MMLNQPCQRHTLEMMLDQPDILKRYKKKKHVRQIVWTMMQLSSSIVARTNFLLNNSNKLLRRSLNTKNKSKIYRHSTPSSTQVRPSSCTPPKRSRISEESQADIKTNYRNAQIRWTLLRTNQNNLTKKINNLGRTFRNSNNNIKFRCRRSRTTLKDL